VLSTNATIELLGKKKLTNEWMNISISKFGLTLDVEFVPNTTITGWVFSLELKNSSI